MLTSINTQFVNALRLIFCIVLCEATGFISSLVAPVNADSWYSLLQKPEWNPPNYIFAPVWTTLYLLMGIALWMIWNRPKSSARDAALYLFAAQLFLNFWWSVIFFKFHFMGLALVEILVMLLMIIVTIVRFSTFSKTAAWLLVPYAAWVSFASLLNYTLWSINS